MYLYADANIYAYIDFGDAQEMAKRLHVVKYMVEATEEWSECKQYDTLTVGRVCNLLLIAQGLSFSTRHHIRPPLLDDPLYLGKTSVDVPGMPHVDTDPISTTSWPPKSFECDPTPRECDFVRDVLTAFRSWPNESLWNLIRHVTPPMYFPEVTGIKRELPDDVIRIGFRDINLEKYTRCEGHDVRVFDRHTNSTLSPDPFMEGVATGILAGRCIVSTVRNDAPDRQCGPRCRRCE